MTIRQLKFHINSVLRLHNNITTVESRGGDLVAKDFIILSFNLIGSYRWVMAHLLSNESVPISHKLICLP